MARKGTVNLPPGFRFHPTDEELVLQYLQRKVFSRPLPAAVIPELELLSRYDPWDLPGCPDRERYFFCIRPEKQRRCPHRASSSGYWKSMGRSRDIVACNQVVGIKKSLVFNLRKGSNGSRTDWFMHEYRLAGIFLQQKKLSFGSTVEEWVLCRIFRKRVGKGGAAAEEDAGWGRRLPNLITLGSSPSDSESSCVTEEASDDDGDDNDEGSCRSSSSPLLSPRRDP
ncbi:unnamed protein product [Spirodela intermedia]|uniref:NAC domain-containing protein n=1 Tax=Spirodela intermedia TaxID=51605 RepID=A0A7I8L3S6_SPIIN|nr:unnamed protein product [Spirodela intermedia]